MNRIFLGLAVTSGTMLVVTFVLGFFVPPRQGGFWHDLHFLVALTSLVVTMMVHSIVYTWFIGTGKWIKEVVHVYGLPEWVNAQAKKHKRRAFPFIFWSIMFLGAAAWLGAYVDTRRDAQPLWHLGVAAVSLAFNLVAFVMEYASILTQARLLEDVRTEADRLRLERVAAASDQPSG